MIPIPHRSTHGIGSHVPDLRYRAGVTYMHLWPKHLGLGELGKHGRATLITIGLALLAFGALAVRAEPVAVLAVLILLIGVFFAIDRLDRQRRIEDAEREFDKIQQSHGAKVRGEARKKIERRTHGN